MKIKDDNYYQISGWMINELHLKGVALQIFAIIFGFSQDGESEFKGSLGYLSEWTGTTKPTVIKALNELVEKNYIIKTQEERNNIIFNSYKANLIAVNLAFLSGKETLPVVKKFNRGSKETLPGGSKETLPNNNNIDNNIDNNRKPQPHKKINLQDEDIDDLFISYTESFKNKQKERNEENEEI